MTMPAPAPTGAGKLLKQWKWILVAIGIVVLAVFSDRGDAQSTGGSGPGNGSDDGSGDGNRCTVEVIADTLNVRAGPGTEHDTVDRLNRGDVVDAELETSGAFRKLADGRWVASEFVRTSVGCG